MKTIIKYEHSELYEINGVYYFGNNGKLYIIPKETMDLIFKEMKHKSNKEILTELINKSEKSFKNLTND
jgi:hypothetical protein